MDRTVNDGVVGLQTHLQLINWLPVDAAVDDGEVSGVIVPDMTSADFERRSFGDVEASEAGQSEVVSATSCRGRLQRWPRALPCRRV